MLVLSRKLDESIKIGNDIKITILRVKGNTIRIGIDAPSNVRVIRSELKAHLESSDRLILHQDDQDAAALPDSVESDEQGQDEAAPTVTAIVDSPAIAATRLFVGKVSRPNPRGPLQLVLNENVTATGSLEAAAVKDERQAPLRAFRRSGQGLTAV